MDFISHKKLEKYIKDHNFSIKQETLEYVVNNLNKKSSKLFKNVNTKNGGAFLPGEFFGVNTGAYSETLAKSPTEMSTTNALNTSTRPVLESNTFPLQDGGCGCAMVGGGGCVTCTTQSAGCGGACGIPHSGGGNSCKDNKSNKADCTCSLKGGCIVCKNFFTQKNLKDISILFNLKLNKNTSKQFNIYLSNDLKKTMHLTFNLVKNKDRLIGKSHFTKALKQI